MKKLLIISLLMLTACNSKLQVGQCIYYPTLKHAYHIIKVQGNTLELMSLQTKKLEYDPRADREGIEIIDCSIVHEVIEANLKDLEKGKQNETRKTKRN